MFRIRVMEIFIQAILLQLLGEYHLYMDPELVTRFHSISPRRFNPYVATSYLDNLDH